MSDNRWVSVWLTPDNTEELSKLVEANNVIGVDVVVSYELHKKYYVMCDRLGNPSLDLVVPNFDLLPEIVLLYDIGMSIPDIRTILEIKYKEGDYYA